MTDAMNSTASITSDARTSGSFATPLSRSDLQILLREADTAAARLVRRLRLPAHECDDLSQDLLVDLISRVKGFDPTRGTLGAFAATILAHRAARLAARIRRDRDLFAPVSLDDPLTGPDGGGTLGDTIAEADGYAAMVGQPPDRFAVVERRLDLDRALGALRGSDLALCGRLIHRTPTELSQDGLGSRATLYRQVQEIRLRLMTAGLAAAA
jgi:DNA-directed RNA polymerase specialized sigma24 family protein